MAVRSAARRKKQKKLARALARQNAFKLHSARPDLVQLAIERPSPATLMPQVVLGLQGQYGSQFVQRPVQRADGSAEISSITQTPDRVAAAIEDKKGGGDRLDDQVRRPMEQFFGVDFTDVKVHTSEEAHVLNRSLQTRACTTGSDIFFSKDAYNWMKSKSNPANNSPNPPSWAASRTSSNVVRRPSPNGSRWLSSA